MTAPGGAPGANIRPPMVRVPDDVLRQILVAHQIVLGDATPVASIGWRGWAESDHGKRAGVNVTGSYDDALCVVTPTASWTFQGNTDPSRTIAGRALLQPGVVEYGLVIHHRTRLPAERRIAFGQQSGVTIRRYDAAGALEKELTNQYIGCNIHDGSITTTGSEACQTVAPEWWMGYVEKILTPLGIPVSEWPTVTTRVKQGLALPDHWLTPRFPYVLIDRWSA